jgi:hypothetical protein
MKTSFRLEIELVPSSLWRSSLCELLPREVWHEVKQRLYTEEGRKCYVCNSKQRLSAHEFWEYDGINHIQRLVAVHHLCSLCHKIKHIGFWCHIAEGKAKLEQQGFDREDLIKHFCSVNACLREEFLSHEEEALDMWRERSRHQWKQDFGEFSKHFE